MAAQPKKDGPQLVNAAQYLGYGLTWALSTGLFLVGGWFVDRWLGTMPLFLIAGAFIGAGAGFYSLYWHMVIEPRQKQEESARELRTGDGRDAGGGGAEGRGADGGEGRA
ncbi:MAG TPA: AtpZ/AtpI family protein [Longimicrobiales bacterium]|nr:AtpZ/AtpI family protein [Longimicrobiales bacterium]